MKTSSFMAAAAACLLPAPVLAQNARSDVQVVETVRYADLDLSRAADRSVLRSRVRHAVSQACGTASSVDLEGVREVRRCRDRALSLTSGQVERAIASATRASAPVIALGQ